MPHPSSPVPAEPGAHAGGRLERVHRHLDTQFPEHLERIRAFLRQPSISAENLGMRESAGMVKAMIEAAGGKAHLVETRRHPLVYGEIDRGKPRTLLIYGMYDVQPVGNQCWRVPPFEAARMDVPGIGDAIVARGALNSKGPLGALMEAIRGIAEAD
ncbi:MAG TPA: hypothetical protein V6D47_18315, partial [Oscillatoriaceae cyanobacterium]